MRLSICLLAICLLSGCFRTIQVPADPVICPPVTILHQDALLPWPDEPARHLPELTKGLKGAQKLAVTLEADKRTIINLETALKLTGRVEDPKE